MEQNSKRKRHDGDDMTTKKFKEEQVDRRNFYDMFFFDEGLCCDTADVGVDTEEQIQEHFLDERSDDEAKIENASDGGNVKLESGCVVKEEINIYDEESISSGSSGTISENENTTLTVAPSSGLLKMKIRLGRINKLVKKKEPSHTNRNTVKKEINSPSMHGESRLDLSDGSLSGEEQNKPILTLSERSSIVIANNGKATNLGNNENETIQRKLHSSSRSRENKLDEKDIENEPFPFKGYEQRWQCFRWLQKHQLIPRRTKCPKCGTDMKIAKAHGSGGYPLKCPKRNVEGKLHSVTRSALNGTVFQHTRIPLYKTLVIMYYFSNNRARYNLLERAAKVSKQTIRDCLRTCRQVCLLWLVDRCSKEHRLGGPNSPVEVVSIVLWKCVDDNSDNNTPFITLCLVEHQGNEISYIMERCLDTNLNTVTSIILKYVNHGTTVVTDVLKSSAFHEDCTHFKVDLANHRLTPLSFKKPALKASILSVVKKNSHSYIPMSFMPTHLCDFLYYREITRIKVDPFWHFLDIVKLYYPGEK